jgi:uncharacterized protein YaaQ
MKLVLAVLQNPDLNPLLRELADHGFTATQIEGDATGGRSMLAGLLVGVEDDEVPDVVALVRATARGRVRRAEPVRPIAERAESWIPAPIQHAAGGASIFVLPVRRFERIGYA